MPASVYGRMLKHKGDLGHLRQSYTYIWNTVGGLYGVLAAFILERSRNGEHSVSGSGWLAGIWLVTAGAWKPYIQSQGSMPLAT